MVNKKKKKVNRRKKTKLNRLVFMIFYLGIILLFIYLTRCVKITSVTLNKDNNKITVEFSSKEQDLYCILKVNNEVPSIDDKEWVKSKDNTCEFDVSLNNSYGLYIKNSNKIVFNNTYKKTLFFEVNNNINEIYLAVNDEYNLKYKYLNIGNEPSKDFINNDNDDVLSIKNNIISTKSVGKDKLRVKYGGYERVINVTVTDLIVSAPNSFNFKKSKLDCNHYSEEENDLLDSILENRVNQVGYKTRAAAVEAARFLTLEFPYRVDYFYENGRIAYRSKKVDGEGRYYHTGLYLNNSRTKNITNISTGPASWGCKMYNNPAKRDMRNGLDCSGFVSWALLNGGYDPGDIGAGITNVYDLTDTGVKKTLSNSLTSGNSIKAGDLLWKSAGGGHIAIIVGIDENNYYVAEALWDDYPETGVIINTYSRKNIANKFKYIIFMDDYYKDEGDYTSLWY